MVRGPQAEVLWVETPRGQGAGHLGFPFELSPPMRAPPHSGSFKGPEGKYGAYFSETEPDHLVSFSTLATFGG